MIKVGQFLSSRLDVLPPEITRELEGLQDEVAAESFERIRAPAEAELGIPLEQAYASFDPIPIAAASLGQAHRARLSPGIAADLGLRRRGRQGAATGHRRDRRRRPRRASPGRPVAVAGAARVDRVDAPALVEEFATTSLEEIDYLHEAANAERFAHDFANDPRDRRARRRVGPHRPAHAHPLRCHRHQDHATSTASPRQGSTRRPSRRSSRRATFQQIFVAGFFHADPHPGNIFVTPGDRATEERLAAHLRRLRHDGRDLRLACAAGLRDFILAVVARDSRALIAVARAARRAAHRSRHRRTRACHGRRSSTASAAWESPNCRSSTSASWSAFARQFGDTIRSLPFQLPESFLLLIRTISLISGVTSALNRDFNMWNAVDPFARTVLTGSARRHCARWASRRSATPPRSRGCRSESTS